MPGQEDAGRDAEFLDQGGELLAIGTISDDDEAGVGMGCEDARGGAQEEVDAFFGREPADQTDA